jgi:hypothetical protein
MNLNLLKGTDIEDTEEKKKAIDYLNDGMQKKNEFLAKTLSGFAEQVTKEELCTRIRNDYFKSFMLRLAITGKKITQEV